MRARIGLLALVIVLSLEATACDDLSRLVDPGTPAPTETLFSEVVRLDVTKTASATPTAGGTAKTPSPPSPIGKRAFIVGTEGNGLNGRAGPSLSQEVKATFAEGSSVRLVEGPVEADGFTWWRAEGEGGSAWVASKWLQIEAAPSPAAPSSTPSPPNPTEAH